MKKLFAIAMYFVLAIPVFSGEWIVDEGVASIRVRGQDLNTSSTYRLKVGNDVSTKTTQYAAPNASGALGATLKGHKLAPTTYHCVVEELTATTETLRVLDVQVRTKDVLARMPPEYIEVVVDYIPTIPQAQRQPLLNHMRKIAAEWIIAKQEARIAREQANLIEYEK